VISVVEILKRTEQYLRQREVPSPRLDSELLLGHVLGLQRMEVYLAHDRPMTDEELTALRPLVSRRGKREPLAWIVGQQSFHTLELIVSADVLVPRPDTETLVEAALKWFDHTTDPLYVADVGCGTGAIGLALASVLPGLRLYAIDQSAKGIACTRDNVQRLEFNQRVGVLMGDLLQPIPTSRPIDWVVSNPPYIKSAVLQTLQPEVSSFEPKTALDGGEDGLDVYRRLIPAAAKRARLGLLVEVGHDQASDVAALFAQSGFTGIETFQDLAGHERVVGGRCA